MYVLKCVYVCARRRIGKCVCYINEYECRY